MGGQFVHRGEGGEDEMSEMSEEPSMLCRSFSLHTEDKAIEDNDLFFEAVDRAVDRRHADGHACTGKARPKPKPEPIFKITKVIRKVPRTTNRQTRNKWRITGLCYDIENKIEEVNAKFLSYGKRMAGRPANLMVEEVAETLYQLRKDRGDFATISDAIGSCDEL